MYEIGVVDIVKCENVFVYKQLGRPTGKHRQGLVAGGGMVIGQLGSDASHCPATHCLGRGLAPQRHVAALGRHGRQGIGKCCQGPQAQVDARGNIAPHIAVALYIVVCHRRTDIRHKQRPVVAYKVSRTQGRSQSVSTKRVGRAVCNGKGHGRMGCKLDYTRRQPLERRGIVGMFRSHDTAPAYSVEMALAGKHTLLHG